MLDHGVKINRLCASMHHSINSSGLPLIVTWHLPEALNKWVGTERPMGAREGFNFKFLANSTYMVDPLN